jgi:hypothetical protein
MAQRPCRACHRAIDIAVPGWLECVGRGTLTSSAGGATHRSSHLSRLVVEHRSTYSSIGPGVMPQPGFRAHDPTSPGTHASQRAWCTATSGAGTGHGAIRSGRSSRAAEPVVRHRHGSPSEHGPLSSAAPQWMSHFDNRTRRGGTHAKRHARHTLCSTDPPDVRGLGDRRTPTRSDLHHARGRNARKREHLSVQGRCVSRRRSRRASAIEGGGTAGRLVLLPGHRPFGQGAALD